MGKPSVCRCSARGMFLPLRALLIRDASRLRREIIMESTIVFESFHPSRHRIAEFKYSLRAFYICYKRPLSALSCQIRGACAGEDMFVRKNTPAKSLTSDKS